MGKRFKSIPLPTEGNLQKVATSIKLILDQLIGASGDLGARAVTYEDLASREVADGINQGGQIIGYDPTKDLSTPPAPTGVAVAVGFKTFIISWANPDQRIYRNPSYAEVWGGATSVLGNATLLGRSSSNFLDITGNTGDTKYFWVRFVSQADITGPYHDTTPISGTLGQLGGADLGDLIITAQKLADGAVDLTTNKVKASTNFGAIAVGFTVTQYLLATSGVMQNLVVDNAQIANLSASKLTVGDGTIGGQLKSANYAAGVAGWILQPNGFAQFPAAGIIGQLTAGQVSTPYLSALSADLGDVRAGMVNFGGFNAYAWPPIGQRGMHLSSSGILLGNFNEGRWIELRQDGTLSTPDFSIGIDGIARFSGLLVAPSGTFGTITAGLLRNAANTNRVNLNASGAQSFIEAPGVRITADGDAYFTKSLASGTWTGSTDILTPGAVRFSIDTGYNKPRDQFSDRTLTARVGSLSISYSPGETTGNYVATLFAQARPFLRKPMFSNGVETPGQNPYGTGNERVFLDVEVGIVDPDGKGTIVLTSLQWTLDTAG